MIFSLDLVICWIILMGFKMLTHLYISGIGPMLWGFLFNVVVDLFCLCYIKICFVDIHEGDESLCFLCYIYLVSVSMLYLLRKKKWIFFHFLCCGTSKCNGIIRSLKV